MLWPLFVLNPCWVSGRVLSSKCFQTVVNYISPEFFLELPVKKLVCNLWDLSDLCWVLLLILLLLFWTYPGSIPAMLNGCMCVMSESGMFFIVFLFICVSPGVFFSNILIVCFISVNEISVFMSVLSVSLFMSECSYIWHLLLFSLMYSSTSLSLSVSYCIFSSGVILNMFPHNCIKFSSFSLLFVISLLLNGLCLFYYLWVVWFFFRISVGFYIPWLCFLLSFSLYLPYFIFK